MVSVSRYEPRKVSTGPSPRVKLPTTGIGWRGRIWYAKDASMRPSSPEDDEVGG